MKGIFYLIAVALPLAAAFSAHAQERSAGQSYDAQINWGALNAKIDTFSNLTKTIATRVDDMSTTLSLVSGTTTDIVACGKQNKIWNGATCVTPPSYKTVIGQIAYPVPHHSGYSAAQACQNAGYEGISSLAPTYSGGAQQNCNGQDCTGVPTATPVAVSGYLLFCYKNVLSN